ncbi:hypothetical protein [Stieleria varia]|uniref:Uncharacterized protein n=1 Tax=Stieleria varia TaxID=2528005 RepID=A0A5C6B2D0_9BACT|nr:hypothetical protein [Stieleria varia]TWU06070.1 hypothetical protein Pla52n_17900 [Stieleria varia]
MKNAIKCIYNDESGFVISTELVLVGTIAVIGLVTGLAAVRDGVVCELSDTAGSVQDLNQSYILNGICGHASQSEGSDYRDRTDFCDSPEDSRGQADNCIHIGIAPTNER